MHFSLPLVLLLWQPISQFVGSILTWLFSWLLADPLNLCSCSALNIHLRNFEGCKSFRVDANSIRRQMVLVMWTLYLFYFFVCLLHARDAGRINCLENALVSSRIDCCNSLLAFDMKIIKIINTV